MDLHAWLNILCLAAEGVSVDQCKSRHRNRDYCNGESVYPFKSRARNLVTEKRIGHYIFFDNAWDNHRADYPSKGKGKRISNKISQLFAVDCALHSSTIQQVSVY